MGPTDSHTLFVISLAGLVAACGQAGAPAHMARDSAGIRIMENRAPAHGQNGWRVAPEPVVRIGTVDGPANQQLTRVVGAARLPDGRIVVADGGTSEIRVYDPAGAWQQSMGGTGGGPGEFGWLAWMQVIPPDTVLAMDGSEPRYAYFLPDGTLVGSGRVDPSVGDYPSPVHRLADGRFLERRDAGAPPAFEGESGHWVTDAVVVAYPPDGGRVDTVASGPGGERMWFTTSRGGRRAVSLNDVPFGRRPLQAFVGDRVYVGSGVGYEIRSANVAGSPLWIRRHHEPRRVGPDQVERWVELRLNRYPESRRPELRSRYAEGPAGDRMPAYSKLVGDAAGNLWVENYRPPWSDAERRWSVFDSAGEWQRDVVLPDGVEVLEIGRDYVLGLVRDELDVEYVVLYPLVRDTASDA